MQQSIIGKAQQQRQERLAGAGRLQQPLSAVGSSSSSFPAPHLGAPGSSRPGSATSSARNSLEQTVAAGFAAWDGSTAGEGDDGALAFTFDTAAAESETSRGSAFPARYAALGMSAASDTVDDTAAQAESNYVEDEEAHTLTMLPNRQNSWANKRSLASVLQLFDPPPPDGGGPA